VNACDEFGAGAVARIVLQQQLACLFVQSRLGIRVNEKALDGDEDVSNSVTRLPILFQGIHTDFAVTSDVWVKYLGRKPT
jgi:hypothetical protein